MLKQKLAEYIARVLESLKKQYPNTFFRVAMCLKQPWAIEAWNADTQEIVGAWAIEELQDENEVAFDEIVRNRVLAYKERYHANV